MTPSKKQILTATATAALVAGLLASCTSGPSITRIDPTTPATSPAPQEPSADNSPAATTGPFATDDEARDAAAAHYELYLTTTAAILQDGGADPERLRPLVSNEIYQNELLGYERAESEGFRLDGAPELLDTTFQERTNNPDTNVETVTVTACISREGIQVVYDDGEAFSIPGVAPRYARDITIDFTPDGPVFTEDGEPNPNVEC